MRSDRARADEGMRRLHPLSVLFGLGRAARIFLLPGLILLVAARPGGYETWLMVLAIPSAISSLLSWYRYGYLLTDDEIVIRTGLFSLRERHVPWERIQDVRLVQGPLQRLLGVAELRIETGGGEGAEASMQVLSTAAVAEIRRQHALAAPAPSAPPVPPGSASPDAGPDSDPLSDAPAGKEPAPHPSPAAPHSGTVNLLDLSATDIILAGLTQGRGWLAVAAIAGIAWEGSALLQDAGVLDLDWSGGAWSLLTGGFRTPGQAWWLALIVLAAFALMRLLSVAWALLTLHGFSLTEKGGDFIVTSGLLTRTTATIPRHRVQSIGVSETWLQRLAGLVSVRAQTAGGREEDGSEGAGHWIAPSLPRGDLPGLIGKILPEVDLAEMRFLPVHPGARRRLLRQWLWLLVGIGLSCYAGLGLPGLILPALLLPLGLVDSRRGAAAMGFAVAERAVVFRKGWWVRRLLAVTSTKMQAIKMMHSPFDRRSGMATLAIDTAGGGSDETAMRLPYLPAETARELLDLLTRRAARSRFRW